MTPASTGTCWPAPSSTALPPLPDAPQGAPRHSQGAQSRTCYKRRQFLSKMECCTDTHPPRLVLEYFCTPLESCPIIPLESCRPRPPGLELCLLSPPERDSCLPSPPLRESCLPSPPEREPCLPRASFLESCFLSPPFLESCLPSPPLLESCLEGWRAFQRAPPGAPLHSTSSSPCWCTEQSSL